MAIHFRIDGAPIEEVPDTVHLDARITQDSAKVELVLTAETQADDTTAPVQRTLITFDLEPHECDALANFLSTAASVMLQVDQMCSPEYRHFSAH